MPQSDSGAAAGDGAPISAAPPPPSSMEEDRENNRLLRSYRKRAGREGARRAEGDIQVYTRGSSFRPRERSETDDMIDRFHSDRKVQELCCMIRQTAAKFLVEHNSVTYGRGYRARQNIPEKTALAFYTGTLEKVAPASSCHVISIGLTELGLNLVVDGTPPPDASLPLGSLQLVNHSCNPNCETEYIETESTLELVVLRSIRHIEAGENISFTYGGTFWRPARSLQRRPRGIKMVHCACTAPSLCPNEYARLEKATGLGFADDLAVTTATPAGLQKILDVIERFCQWSGMRVKMAK